MKWNGSALGDNIHFNTINYLNHGTKRIIDGNNPYQVMSNFLIERTQNLRTVKQETLNTLRERVANDSETQEQRERDGIQQIFQEGLNDVAETLANSTSKERFQSLLGSSEGYKGNINKQSDFLVNKAIKEGKTSISQQKQLSTFNTAKKELNEKIDKINAKGWVNEQDINFLIEQYKKIQNIIGTIKIPSIQGLSDKHSSLKNKSQIKSFIGQLQLALDDIEIITTQKLVNGAFGELIVRKASDQFYNTAVQESNKMIEQKIVGDKRTEASIPTQFIAKDLSPVSGVTFTQNHTSYYISPTQDKVDVQITVNREDIFASVKSYRTLDGKYNKWGSTNDVHLQSPISLFYPLAFLNGVLLKDFGNHWINMHAANKPQLIPNNWIENADLILKQELAYEALVTGNPWKAGVTPADTFITIERSTGRVAAYNSKDLLLNHFNYFIFEPNIEHMKIANRRSEEIEDRITNILMQTRQLKVTVSYKIGKMAEWY